MEVFEEFRRNIARVARMAEADITPETPLEDIKADSLHWVQILIGTEAAFDIEIDIDRDVMGEMKTVGDFVKYIETFINK